MDDDYINGELYYEPHIEYHVAIMVPAAAGANQDTEPEPPSVFDPADFNYFATFDELSYVHNSFMRQVESWMHDQPCRLVFTSRTAPAETPESLATLFGNGYANIVQQLDQAHRGDGGGYAGPSNLFRLRDHMSQLALRRCPPRSFRYLVNISQRLYVDLYQLVDDVAPHGARHPLAFLTVEGGGIAKRYEEGPMNAAVGSWARDWIYMSDQAPDNGDEGDPYELVEYRFNPTSHYHDKIAPA